MQPIDWEGADEGAEAEFAEYYEEDAPYTGLLGGIEESATDFAETDADGADHEYEFPEDVDEFEATALNALADLGEADDDKNVGDAIQLQLAAFAAFGRAKGKGKGKPKGKGKVIRSNLSIEQRRKRLAEIKAKSNASVAGDMDIGQATQLANFREPRDPALDPKVALRIRIRSQLPILPIFPIHLQMMECFCMQPHPKHLLRTWP